MTGHVFFMCDACAHRDQPHDGTRTFIDFAVPFHGNTLICLDQGGVGRGSPPRSRKRSRTAGRTREAEDSLQRFQSGDDMIDMAVRGDEIILSPMDRAGNRCTATMDLASFRERMNAAIGETANDEA